MFEWFTCACWSWADCIMFHGHQETLSFDKSEGHVDVSHVSSVFAAVEFNMVHLFPDSVQNFVIKSFNVFCIFLHLILGYLASFSKANDKRSGQSTWSESSFLSTSIDKRSQSDSWFSSQVKCTYSFGSIQFVTRNAHQIYVQLIHINRYLSNGLSPIGMEENSFFSAELTNFFNILNNSNFVVDIDNTDTKDGNIWLLNSFSEEINIDKSTIFNRQIGDFKSFKLKIARGVQNAFMFNLSCNYVLLLISIEFWQPFQHHVVTLCGTRGEDYLFFISTDQVGHLLSSLFYSCWGVPAELMCFWMRIAVTLCEVR